MRGHLRVCATCRTAAEDTLAVRDAVAELPTPDVPPSLWATIQSKLAECEVADSRRSRWWLWWHAARPKLIPGALVAAAAGLAVVAWVRREHAANDTAEAPSNATVAMASPPPIDNPVPLPSVSGDCDLRAVVAGREARVALADMSIAIDRCYEGAMRELLVLVDEVRPAWPRERAVVFHAELEDARRAIAIAVAGRPRERAWQALILLLQRTVSVPVLAEVTP